jgi:PhnB protein
MSNPSQEVTRTFFAPHLALRNVLAGITFYQKAFGALELRRWSNDDGSVHVAEMGLDGALFHLHEEVLRTRELSPETLKGVTSVIGVFVSAPDALMQRAVAAGGTESNPMQDYDYGYRQGTVIDPFGHHWLIQRKVKA